jgi:hypothetical protein
MAPSLVPTPPPARWWPLSEMILHPNHRSVPTRDFGVCTQPTRRHRHSSRDVLAAALGPMTSSSQTWRTRTQATPQTSAYPSSCQRGWHQPPSLVLPAPFCGSSTSSSPHQRRTVSNVLDFGSDIHAGPHDRRRPAHHPHGHRLAWVSA